jgi:hypothetical protein
VGREGKEEEKEKDLNHKLFFLILFGFSRIASFLVSGDEDTSFGAIFVLIQKKCSRH